MIFFPGTPATPVTPANASQSTPDPWLAQITSTDTLAAVAQILQSPQGQQVWFNYFFQYKTKLVAIFIESLIALISFDILHIVFCKDSKNI